MCRDTDIISKPLIWDLKMYTVYYLELVEFSRKVPGCFTFGVERVSVVDSLLTPAPFLLHQSSDRPPSTPAQSEHGLNLITSRVRA